ncbi:hypothetical protein TSO5_15885 [Azospirillum sp. TSO5]|nr:hypothetical protein TSO5_15885 [Azospirillum sp. TSO5]
MKQLRDLAALAASAPESMSARAVVAEQAEAIRLLRAKRWSWRMIGNWLHENGASDRPLLGGTVKRYASGCLGTKGMFPASTRASVETPSRSVREPKVEVAAAAPFTPAMPAGAASVQRRPDPIVAAQKKGLGSELLSALEIPELTGAEVFLGKSDAGGESVPEATEPELIFGSDGMEFGDVPPDDEDPVPPPADDGIEAEAILSLLSEK